MGAMDGAPGKGASSLLPQALRERQPKVIRVRALTTPRRFFFVISMEVNIAGTGNVEGMIQED